jgi:hypothetical protein
MMLEHVLEDIKGKLNSDEWLQKHYWKAEREDDGEIINTLKASLETAGEGCLMVIIIGAINSERSSSKRPIGMLQVVVACMETPELNRFRSGFASALQAAEHIAVTLNLRQVGADVLAKPRIKLESLTNKTATYNVTFDLHHVLEKGASPCQTP